MTTLFSTYRQYSKELDVAMMNYLSTESKLVFKSVGVKINNLFLQVQSYRLVDEKKNIIGK